MSRKRFTPGTVATEPTELEYKQTCFYGVISLRILNQIHQLIMNCDTIFQTEHDVKQGGHLGETVGRGISSDGFVVHGK